MNPNDNQHVYAKTTGILLAYLYDIQVKADVFLKNKPLHYDAEKVLEEILEIAKEAQKKAEKMVGEI